MCTRSNLAASPAELCERIEHRGGIQHRFLHYAGFIGGAKSYEGALKMAQAGLKLP